MAQIFRLIFLAPTEDNIMIFAKKLLRSAAIASLTLAAPALATQATAPAATPAPAAATTDADPALWVIRDADTTIYLFGTVHLLRPGLGWFDEAVRDAFNASDELRIEVITPEDPASLGPLIGRFAVDPNGKTMTQRLTPDQLTRYQAGMQAAGIPAAAVDQFEPWFVGLTLSLSMIQTMGFEANSGAETVLQAAAREANKPITAFETVEQQLGFLDSAPEGEQIAGIFSALEQASEGRALFEGMITSWAAGDPDATGRLLNQALTATPETARILLTDRNRRWADTLTARMEQQGTLFVAVGAGHLTGDNSVQHFLNERGVTVTRVAY
jgi:uncharacterized protein